jgi:hypothetical protein
MKIDEYLERYRTPVNELARRANLNPLTIRYIIKGKDVLLSVAKAVSEATYGEVTLEDLAARKPWKAPRYEKPKNPTKPKPKE